MKLLKCHIENFGKLSNFNYKFKDGINTIEEDNGFGKTTFANFIKAMFYGLETKRITKVLTDRKKYEPWQGGAFGGSIEFEVNNKTYRLERFFGKKETEDTFKLYDLSTNLETNDFTPNIGEEIFKLNKEAYERSTFISGQDMETSMNDSLSAKLGNILENENDVNTSEKALKVLDDAIKNYKKTGGRGEINEKTFEKIKLEKKLEQSKNDERTLEDRKEQNNEILEQIREKEQEQDKLKKIYTSMLESETKKAKKENYKIFEDNLKESKAKIDECEKFFGGEIPKDSEIQALIDKSLLIEKCKAQMKSYNISPEEIAEINNLKKQFQNEDISEGIINKKIEDYNSLGEKRNKIDLNNEKITNSNKERTTLNKQIKVGQVITLFMCLFSIIIIMIAIVSVMKGSTNFVTIEVAVGVIGLVVVTIGSITLESKKRRCKNIEKELANTIEDQKELKEDEEYIQKDIDEFINEFSDNELGLDNVVQLTEIKARYMKYKNLKDNIDTTFEKQNEIMQKLDELEKNVKDILLKYFSKITKPYINYAQEIQMKKREYDKQIQDYDTKLKAKEEYEKTNDTQLIEIINEAKQENPENIVNKEDIEKLDKKEIEENLKTLSEELDKLNDEKNYNKNQIEMLESNLDETFDIENELEQLNTKIDEMKENCNILEKTKELLEIAKNQFSSHYMGGMQKSFIKNLGLINGTELDASLDVNLDVQINELGSNKELRYFSTGYKDLIYMCMRLSLIESLFEEENPFIILDDPFVNMDKNKIKNALNLIKNISKKYQIIYFICHESRG